MTSTPETPETFETKISDTIRTLQIWCMILTGALVLTIVIAAVGFSRSNTATNGVKNLVIASHKGLVNQTENRTRNVGVWCGSINKLEGELEGYVARFPKAIQLQLDRLDCSRLEQNTLASTKP